MSAVRGQGRGGFHLAVAACVVVVATLAVAIGVMGTPGQQRLARLDVGRVDDLEALVRAVRRRAQVDGALPATLQAATAGTHLRTTDRVTGVPYGYATRGASVFELCAVFDTDTAQVRSTHRTGWRGTSSDWDHPAGRHCFDIPLKESD